MHIRQVILFGSLFFFCFSIRITAQEEGIASYYHKKFHGRKMAGGRIHDREELVAAHRTLPFGTYVRVTNLSNMKWIVVCIEDRGPFRKGWIIDVSEEAAEQLDFIRKGITKVRLEIVPGPDKPAYRSFIYPPKEIPMLNTDKYELKKAIKVPYRFEESKKSPGRRKK